MEDGQALREVIRELRASKEERRQQEGRIAERSELVISLNAQVKGKGKKSDPTPEPSATAARGGNSGNRPPPPQQAAPRAPGGGDSDDDEDEDEGPEKGRLDERPATRGNGPEQNEEEEEATGDELRFSRALEKAIGETTKRQRNLPLNMNTPNTRMLGFDLQPAKISLTATHTNGKTRRIELNMPYPS